ncbi:MAG: YkgJ family cysteine cluster protein [Thermoproteota archaeon]
MVVLGYCRKSMVNPCVKYGCVKCCVETEMLLLEEDVERIMRTGFEYEYFVVNRDGWLYLKNVKGMCVFNDGEKCLIYENRPLGCRLYPLVYDEDQGIITLDEYCPYREEFKVSRADRDKLFSLIKRLEEERRLRIIQKFEK